ncbi:MAG: hypothetical protein K0R65_623 [Crocinitomicaceae bacterium]|jgi:hypothetical protein|nr:hypothetical protein [Crocinitomicaceae bacterium]
MKKIIVFLFLFAFVRGKCQSLIEDAITIREHIDPQTGMFNKATSARQIILPILRDRYFYLPVDSLNTYHQLKKFTDTNGAVRNPYVFSLTPDHGGAVNDFVFPKLSGMSLSSLAGTDVTVFANALANFMVKRAKQELSMAFFERFKDDLNKKEFSDLKILFPATFKLLSAFGDEIYNYDAYLNGLREAFEKDLSQMIYRVPKVWEQDKYEAFFENHKELKDLLYMANELSQVLVNGKHPGDALHDLAFGSLAMETVQQKNNVNTLRLLDLALQSFRSSEPGRYWVSADTLKRLVSDPILQKIYLGLLLQKEKDYNIHFEFAQKRDLHDLLISKAPAIMSNTSEFVSYFQKLVPKVNEVERQIKLVTDTSKVNNQEIYTLFNSFIDLIECSFEIEKVKLFGDIELKIPVDFKTSLYISRLTNETFIDVAKKNYNSAILNSALILDTVLVIMSKEQDLKPLRDFLDDYTSKKELKEKVKDGYAKEVSKLIEAALKNKSYVSGFKRKKNLETSYKELEDKITDTVFKKKLIAFIESQNRNKYQHETVKKMLRYGTLAANLVMAKNAEEAEAAIEAIALPPGSARLKKEMHFSVSLNSYLGGFYGTNNWFKPHSNSYGISGLVGVGVNWGGCSSTRPSSYSAFLSLLDVGTLATIREGDTSNYNMSVKLNQIVSPGLFFIYGFPRAPLSFIAGYQYVPPVPGSSTTGFVKSSDPGRFTLGISVDIPILHVYNRSKGL